MKEALQLIKDDHREAERMAMRIMGYTTPYKECPERLAARNKQDATNRLPLSDSIDFYVEYCGNWMTKQEEHGRFRYTTTLLAYFLEEKQEPYFSLHFATAPVRLAAFLVVFG